MFSKNHLVIHHLYPQLVQNPHIGQQNPHLGVMENVNYNSHQPFYSYYIFFQLYRFPLSPSISGKHYSPHSRAPARSSYVVHRRNPLPLSCRYISSWLSIFFVFFRAGSSVMIIFLLFCAQVHFHQGFLQLFIRYVCVDFCCIRGCMT